MKVKDISSYFKKPSTSGATLPESPTTVKVPTRRTKKVKKAEHLEPTPSDEEDPLPREYREKKEVKKRKRAKVLSDSDEDDDDFKVSRTKIKKLEEVEEKKKVEVKKPEVKVEKPKKSVDPTDFFSNEKVKQKRTEPASQAEKKAKSPVKMEEEVLGTPEKRSRREKQEQSPSKSSPRTRREASGTPKKSETKVKIDEFEEIKPKRDRSQTPKKEAKIKTPEKQKSPKEVKQRSETPTKPEDKRTPSRDKKKHKRDATPPSPVKASPKKQESPKMKKAKKVSKKADSDSELDEEDNKKKTKKAKKSTEPKKASRKSVPKTPPPPKSSPEKAEADKKRNANFAKFKAKENLKPRNLGEKVIPIGAKDCLDKKTFVITGILDSLERDSCTDLIVRYSGRVTGSVSGKTSYLIVGEEPGDSKVKKAENLGIPFINEDGLLEMIRKSNPDGNNNEEVVEMMDLGDSEEEPEIEVKKSKSTSENSGKKEDTQSQNSKSVKMPIVPLSLMWVDKYRPKTIKQIVGQGRDASNAHKLIRWLSDWFKNLPGKDGKAKAGNPFFKDPEGKTFKCALLSGSPGIGKTTTAHLACREVGYDYFELNASDTRNKKGLHANVADALSCKTIFGGINDLTEKHVLIMDEVDGMSGNEDRGGVQELITLIKGSKVPIICICNDRNHQKIRSLSNYCYDLRFTKPTVQELKGFISSIAFKEKIKMDPQKLVQLCISTDQDVRQILHQLELYKESNADNVLNPKKDLKFGPWDVCRKIFLKQEHENMSIHDKTGLFFQDYSFGPLFVQENYLKWKPARAKGNRHARAELIARSAASIAEGDLIETMIRKTNNWSLLPVQAIFSSYIPGELMEADTMGKLDFPQWLGKNSNKNKRVRLLQSLHTHVHLEVSGSLEALNMDYLPYLRRKICGNLANENIEEAAAVMETYSLLRDDLESINDLSLWPGGEDPMKKVESRMKAAFTRLVNKDVLPYSNEKSIAKRGKGKGGDSSDLEGLGLEEGEEEEDEQSEDEAPEKDLMIKMKTKKKKKDDAVEKTPKSKKNKKDDKKDDEAGPSKAKKSRKK